MLLYCECAKYRPISILQYFCHSSFRAFYTTIGQSYIPTTLSLENVFIYFSLTCHNSNVVNIVNNQMSGEHIEFGRSPLSLNAITNNFNILYEFVVLIINCPRPRLRLLRGYPLPRPPRHSGLGEGGSGHAGQGGSTGGGGTGGSAAGGGGGGIAVGGGWSIAAAGGGGG